VVPVGFEARDEPCTRCGALVAIKIITEDKPRTSPRRREAIHEDDGTPADESCRRVATDHGTDA
jgi:hypothetical protein